jgi:hypothetical protein
MGAIKQLYQKTSTYFHWPGVLLHKTEFSVTRYHPEPKWGWCIIDNTETRGVDVAKQLITLVCETCGRKFEAQSRRRAVHCQECAEELRRKSLGPIQIKRRTSATPISSKIQVKEMSWERAESDLAY